MIGKNITRAVKRTEGFIYKYVTNYLFHPSGAMRGKNINCSDIL